MTVVEALLAIAASDRTAAMAAADTAVEAEPSSLVAPALARHLRRTGADGVYDEPTAFERFIDGGGNLVLYERTIDALAAVHRDLAPSTVLDVGCGDGRVTASVVGAATRIVDLVEPSAELLAAATAAVEAAGPEVRSHRSGVEAHLAAGGQRWDLVQSSFALHTLEPEVRSTVLSELAERTDRVLVVEFDVPELGDRSVEHAAYVAERYELGLAEYADDPEVVDGFLLPVMVGQFDPTRIRHTFEQSAGSWVAQLEAAGFAVEVREVSPYWWATACLFDARVTRRRRSVTVPS